MSSKSIQERAREAVGKVLLARESLTHFSEYMSEDADGEQWYVSHPVHRLMDIELEAVLRFLETDGKEGIQFLMVLIGPQFGKTLKISQHFPAFALGRLPHLSIIQVSYGADLAVVNSRKVRDMVISPRYREVFGDRSPSEEPVMLSSDSKGASSWELAAPSRGGMVAAGIGGAVAGRRKGLGIFDDPIKGEKEAQSEKVREDAWDFYINSFRQRMKAGVLVTTRWHPDDPAGRIIKEMVSGKSHVDQWKIIMLPTIIDEGMFATDLEEQKKRMKDGVYLPLADPLGRSVGEVVCPEMMSKDEVLRVRALSERSFMALHQQMPYNKAGQRYKREWFETVTKLPDDVQILYVVRYWDKANSTDGDYTAGVLMAYCTDGRFYILDVTRGRWTSYERDNKMREVALKDQERWGDRYHTNVYVWHQQDPGSAGKDSAEATNRNLIGIPAHFETVSGDKETRSDPLEGAFQGKLVLLLQAAWNEAFIDECVAFPRGKFDDQVDAGSSAYSKLLQMIDNGGAVGKTASAEAVVVEADALFGEEVVDLSDYAVTGYPVVGYPV